jgi:hypothetical protein
MANRRYYFWAAVGLLVFCVLCVALPAGYFFLTDRWRGEPAAPAGPAASFSALSASRSAADPQPVTEFAQADAINVFFTLESPENRLRIIRGKMFALAAEGLAAETHMGDAQGTSSGGQGWIQFSSSRPWPLGSYRIDMTIDDTPAGSLDVSVVNTNTSGAQLQNVFTSLDQAGGQRTETFPTAGSIFVQFSLANAPLDTFVQGIMVAEDASGLPSGAQVAETSGRLGDGSYWFEFFNNGPWPVGTYTIYIYLNGQFIQQAAIRIQ